MEKSLYHQKLGERGSNNGQLDITNNCKGRTNVYANVQPIDRLLQQIDLTWQAETAVI